MYKKQSPYQRDTLLGELFPSACSVHTLTTVKHNMATAQEMFILLGLQCHHLLIIKSSTGITPELNKLRNARLERGVGMGSNFKERCFVCKKKSSSLDRSKSTRSYTILFMLRSQTQAKIFYIFRRSCMIRKQFIS